MFWKLFAVACLLVTIAAGVLVLNRTAEGAPPAPTPACHGLYGPGCLAPE